MCLSRCASGLAVLNLEYRRCGAGGGGGGFPSTLADVAHGIDWLASEAARETYGLDASRVALVGHSAGAQLVLWAAQRESLPRRAGGAGGDDELDATAAGEADALRAALTEGGRAGPRAVRPRCVVSVGGCIDLGFARTDARQQRRARPAVESFLLAGEATDDGVLAARLELACLLRVRARARVGVRARIRV